MLSQVRKMAKLLDLKKHADFLGCVAVARTIFEAHYDHSIRNLLGVLPEDHLDTHVQPFWSGPKRAPSAFTFDANDELHFNFVVSCANLIAFNLQIDQERDHEKLMAMTKATAAGAYVSKAIKV